MRALRPARRWRTIFTATLRDAGRREALERHDAIERPTGKPLRDAGELGGSESRRGAGAVLSLGDPSPDSTSRRNNPRGTRADEPGRRNVRITCTTPKN